MSEFGTILFDPHAACRHSSAASVASAEEMAARTGLVSISTSHTFDESGHSHADVKSVPAIVFSTASARLKKMRFNVRTAAAMLDSHATRGGFRVDIVMVTLTYRPGAGFEGKHISQYLTHARNWCRRRRITCRYVWVAELQERGALHYHVLFWLPHGVKLPKPDLSGWWPHGSSRIERARHAVGYVCKYASKTASKVAEGGTYPPGARMHGRGGLTRKNRVDLAWCNLPGWLRQLVWPEHRCKRIRGGGFVSRETHEFWPSPWRLAGVSRVGGGSIVTIVPALAEGLALCSAS